MIKKVGDFIESHSRCIIAIIITIQVLLVSYIFAFEKEGFHIDEIWTYGFANSYYEPYLFMDSDLNPYYERTISGDELSEYIIVEPQDRFNYKSVFYNQRNDMHPPVYCTLVNFVCSLLPGTFSKYYAYVLNVIAMIVGQIYLFKSGALILKSNKAALLPCFFWGFTTAFINVNIYLRTYSLLVMCTNILMFYCAKLYDCTYKEVLKRDYLLIIIKIACTVLLGSLFHHYFLVVAFAFTAFICLAMLVRKKWKLMLCYGFSMLATVILSLLIFPQTIMHMTDYTVGMDDNLTKYRMPFSFGIRYSWLLMLHELTGLSGSIYKSADYSYIIAGCIILLGILAPLCFLFRNEDWFKKILNRLKGILISIKNKISESNNEYIPLVCCGVILVQFMVVSYSADIYGMKEQTDRYIFFVMPCFVLAVIYLLKYIFELINPIKKYSDAIIIAMCCCAIICSNIFCDKVYIFKNHIVGEGGIESTCTENSRYIMVLADYSRITVYPYLLRGCDEAFVTTTRSYKDADLSGFEINDQTYVLIDSTQLDMKNKLYDNERVTIDSESFKDIPSEDQVIQYLEKNDFPGYRLEFYGSQFVFGSRMHIFQIVNEQDYVEKEIRDYT